MGVEYVAGDVAQVEGRVAVYMPTRWEWMDGTWTAIPSSVGPVLFNVYDQAALASGSTHPKTAKHEHDGSGCIECKCIAVPWGRRGCICPGGFS